MAKKKHPIYRLHKIVIHPNRWLIWAIAYLIFVAIAMVGYIKITDESVVELQAEQVFHSWNHYENPQLGFALRYPTNWTVTTAPGDITFGPANNPGIEVSVYKPTAERTIRKPLHILSETPIAVDGIWGNQITNKLKDGSSETLILAKTLAHIYVIRGSESDVNKTLLTFNFIPIQK